MTDFSFDRQDLRGGTSIAEFDYERIDPRTYLRELKRDIQEVTAQGMYKYSTVEPEENPRVVAEGVGSASGRVEGRLVARTNWEKFAGTRTEEENRPLGAIVAAVLGVLLALFGFTMEGDGQGAVIGLGVLLLIAAAVLYYLNEPDVRQSEYYYRKQARILLEGEVAEHAAGGDPADVVASDLTVVCSENLEIEYRDTGGSRRVAREELPEDVQGQLDTGYTPLAEEVSFDDGATDVYCYRTS